MKNFVQNGNRLRLYPSESVNSGDVVIVGEFAGIACGNYDVADGDGVICDLNSVYELPKAVGAWEQGVKLFYDAADAVVTATESGNAFIGHSADVAATDAPTCLVRLKG